MRRSSTRWSAVKAMVWKEWRERFLWALAATAGFAIVATFFCYSAYADLQFQFLRENGFKSMCDAVETVLGAGTPLFAFCLGFAQMQSEGKRDRWAFLVHRPATRMLLFWSKALAGLSLCALVVSVVLGGFLLWVGLYMQPPLPWSWRLMEFVVPVLVLSAGLYFTGALLALRERIGFFNRIVPLGAALLVAILVGNLWLQGAAWQINLLMLSFVAASAMAAQGCFQSDTSRTRNLWTQGALASVLAAGLGQMYLVVVLALAVSESNLPKTSSDQASYEVTNGGQIVLRQVKYTGRGNEEKANISLSDLNGQVVATGFQKKKSPYQIVPFAVESDARTLRPMPGSYDANFEFWSEALYGETTVAWWFDRVQRRFIGLNAKTSHVYGYIGTNGFSQNARDCQSFDEAPSLNNYRSEGLIQFPHSLYVFEPASKSVARVYQSSDEIERVASRFGSDDAGEMTFSCPFVVMRNGVAGLSSTRYNAFDVHGDVIPITDTSQYVFAISSAQGRIWLRCTPRLSGSAPTKIFELSQRAELLATHVLPPLPVFDGVDSWAARGAVALLPAVLSRWNVREVQRSVAISAQTPTQRSARDGILLSVVFSALATLATWRRANRYAFKSSTRLWWTISVFALGPLGYLLMRSLLDWPALEKCPSCGKLRVVDRELCEHCNSPFAPPLLDRTEIIEDAAPEMPALRLAS